VRFYTVHIGEVFATTVLAKNARAAAHSLGGYWKAQGYRVWVVVYATGEVVDEELWR